MADAPLPAPLIYCPADCSHLAAPRPAAFCNLYYSKLRGHPASARCNPCRAYYNPAGGKEPAPATDQPRLWECDLCRHVKYCGYKGYINSGTPDCLARWSYDLQPGRRPVEPGPPDALPLGNETGEAKECPDFCPFLYLDEHGSRRRFTCLRYGINAALDYPQPTRIKRCASEPLPAPAPASATDTLKYCPTDCPELMAPPVGLIDWPPFHCRSYSLADLGRPPARCEACRGLIQANIARADRPSDQLGDRLDALEVVAEKSAKYFGRLIATARRQSARLKAVEVMLTAAGLLEAVEPPNDETEGT